MFILTLSFILILFTYRVEPVDLSVPLLKLPELVEDNEEDLFDRDDEKQGDEVPLL